MRTGRPRRAATFVAALLVVLAGACRTTADAPAAQADAPTVVIEVGDAAAAVVARAAAGSHFEFAPGLHRGVSLVPRTGDVFTARPGAVLSGAILLSGFTEEAGLWTAPAPPGGQAVGECRVERPACALPEELFLDGEPLRRVATRADVGPGTWMLDAAAGRVVMADAPAGRQVELSVLASAVSGNASTVTISGLQVEHYANPAGRGAIHMEPGARDWRVEDCVVQDTHGVGVLLRDRSTLVNCWLEGNGQQGAGGEGTGITVRDSVIARNNRAGFSPGWSAGGAKFALTTGLHVVRNVVVGNDGPGLWTDIDCVDTTYEGNWVQDNTEAGIQHEISGPAAIVGNRIIGNGRGATAWVWGAGIQIVNSDGVVVRDNQLQGNRHGVIGLDQERGAGARGQRVLRDLTVTGNVVVDSGQTGIAQDHAEPAVFARGQRFDANRYQGAVSWTWLDAERSWEQWRAYGHDPAGEFQPSS